MQNAENSAHFSERKAEMSMKNELEHTQKKRADGRSAHLYESQTMKAFLVSRDGTSENPAANGS